nr:DUF362 domain-containing protein [Bacillota bacterium]
MENDERMTSAEHGQRVAVFRDPGLSYPASPPFNPPLQYPEYPFKGKGGLDETNHVYTAVRETLHLLGLDEAHYNQPDWNPLGEIVRPGDRVVISPNFIMDYHVNSETIFSIATHGSVIRAIADYVEIALRGNGRILFADAPQFNARFERLVEQTGLGQVAQFYERFSSVETGLMDLRRVRSTIQHGLVVDREVVDAFETESVIVDLGTDSMFPELGETLSNLFGSDYDRRETCSHHNRSTNEYCISKRVLESDVLIGVPKLKTHKKTGVTLSLKNFVGINTDKNFLPHYRVGDALEGGDEFPVERDRILRMKTKLVRKTIDSFLARRGKAFARTVSWLLPILFPVKERGAHSSEQPQIDAFYRRFLHKSVRTGNWEGNDTTWRMVLDIARAFFYAGVDGKVRDTRQRRFFAVIDGIIGGDMNGPMASRPRREGVLVAGRDPVAVDFTATRIMGFDPMSLRTLARAMQKHRLHLGSADKIVIETNWDNWKGGITPENSLQFRAPDHWDSIVAWSRTH